MFLKGRKKSDVELILSSLIVILLGFFIYVLSTYVIKSLVLHKASLSFFYILEASYLASVNNNILNTLPNENYVNAGSLIFSKEEYKKIILEESKSLDYIVDFNDKIWDLKSFENGIKINNYCFYLGKGNNPYRVLLVFVSGVGAINSLRFLVAYLSFGFEMGFQNLNKKLIDILSKLLDSHFIKNVGKLSDYFLLGDLIYKKILSGDVCNKKVLGEEGDLRIKEGDILLIIKTKFDNKFYDNKLYFYVDEKEKNGVLVKEIILSNHLINQ